MLQWALLAAAHEHDHASASTSAASASPQSTSNASGGSFMSLLFLCLMMFAGSFLPGYLPLWLVSGSSMSSRKVRLLNAVGAGLLISTALAVILPEGVHQLVTTPSLDQTHLNHQHLSQRYLLNSKLQDSKSQFLGIDELDTDDQDDDIAVWSAQTEEARTTCAPCTLQSAVHFDEKRLAYIGYSLAGGFLFMLIVEKLSGFCGGGGGHGHAHHQHDADELHLTELEELESPGSESRRRRESVSSNSGRTNAASIGLIVHCAIDGVAMGSVAASHNTSQEFIVFVAILLHKAPSALGISTFLIQRRLPHKKIVRQLLIFALSAPVSSVITYFLLTFGEDGAVSEDLSSQISRSLNLAMCLLFSAGTFLYVATVHVLSEIKSPSEASMSWQEVLAVSVGVVLPLALSLGGHAH
eukprot:TRINITY_DN5783_c0_g1_i2.p1 TRINITY_DN5783_c0_g1~~TRINITY_DN5783_c0_g1_i2.p1  ORF type:complete len:412 (-),score=91.55 TRINITY_DN5783_c0_g1_i2:78-1313(-)